MLRGGAIGRRVGAGHSRRNSESTPLQSTLFFPLSGDPVGFNHFAAVEAVLRDEPALECVVFILSNGFQPDPTKPDAEAAPAARL